MVGEVGQVGVRFHFINFVSCCACAFLLLFFCYYRDALRESTFRGRVISRRGLG
jgi:hypothetical protein